MNSPDILLPSSALKGVCVGISVSESTDLERLGLLEIHFRLAIGEIARCMLVSGGELAYGGHLDPKGYTTFLIGELNRYGRRDFPLRVFLAWPIHRNLTLTNINKSRRNLGLYGRIICLDVSGNEIDPANGRGDEVPDPDSDEIKVKSYSMLRQYMGDKTSGRILIGGKRHGFQGSLPGLMEEALVTLKSGKPLYLAGGFGGVTADIIQALGLNGCSWIPNLPDAPAEDYRMTEGRRQLAALSGTGSWSMLNNGLTEEENLKLASSHRPSEIAALLGLGLGRVFNFKKLI